MKKLLFFLIASFVLISCSEEQTKEPNFRLREFSSGYMEYKPLPYYDKRYMSDYCGSLEYKEGKVSKIIHKYLLPTTSIGDIKYSDYILYYDVSYSGNQIQLTKKMESNSGADIIYEPEVIQLTLDNNGRIIKRININYKDTTDYYYLENGLIVKSIFRNGGFTTRTQNFHFDSNKNLIRINTEFGFKGDNDYRIINEYFEDFDTGINGFKDLGVVEGAFIRSLSQNNFNTYSRATYLYNKDSSNFSKIDSLSLTLKVIYDENGYPIYGHCPREN